MYVYSQDEIFTRNLRRLQNQFTLADKPMPEVNIKDHKKYIIDVFTVNCE